MRKLQIISVSHHHTTATQRIQLGMDQGRWQQLLTYIKYELHAEGVVRLATCNRIEIYCEASTDIRQQVADRWLALAGDIDTITTQVFKTYLGSAIAVRYLLQLSIGMKSAIYGDDQILSQLKKSFEQSRAAGQLSTLLERAYQTVMRFHKQICRETAFKSQTVSLAYQALKSLTTHYGKTDLASKTVLIIGAGDMAAQVVKYQSKFKFRAVTITNRTVAKAHVLVEGKSITVADYQKVNSTRYDIIISCTDQGRILVDTMGPPEFYIDLSIASATHEPLGEHSIRLETIQQKIDTQNQTRMACIGVVKRYLGVHVEEFAQWLVKWEARQAEILAV